MFEEGTWLLAATSFETTNIVFNLTDENNSFSILALGYCRIANFLPEGVIDKLNELLQLRSQNDIEFHVKRSGNRGTRIEIENSG